MPETREKVNVIKMVSLEISEVENPLYFINPLQVQKGREEGREGRMEGVNGGERGKDRREGGKNGRGEWRGEREG